MFIVLSAVIFGLPFFAILWVRTQIKAAERETQEANLRTRESLAKQPKASLLIKTKDKIYTERFEAKTEKIFKSEYIVYAGYLASRRREQIVSQPGHFVLTNDKLVHVGDIVDLEVVIDKP